LSGYVYKVSFEMNDIQFQVQQRIVNLFSVWSSYAVQ